MAAALAIQAAGGVMVPIYPAWTAEQAAYVLAHSDAKVLFVDTPALLGRVLRALVRARPASARSCSSTTALDVAAVLGALARRGQERAEPAEVEAKRRRLGLARSPSEPPATPSARARSSAHGRASRSISLG